MQYTGLHKNEFAARAWVEYWVRAVPSHAEDAAAELHGAGRRGSRG